ncbi:MAG TPA: hypothetical protein DCL13_06220 [Peptococcaceae bacterium]|nr:hypothetical protein [Peptococcaceae bacterium]
MSKKIPGTDWIFTGFVPWILYWTLSGPGLWTEQKAGAVFWLSVALPFVLQHSSKNGKEG